MSIVIATKHQKTPPLIHEQKKVLSIFTTQRLSSASVREPNNIFNSS